MPLHTASDVALSVSNGVEGCLWPISVNTILIYTASRAMMYNAANSASVADVMTCCLMMCAMLNTAPLLAGIVASLERKKRPPVLLRACGCSLR